MSKYPVCPICGARCGDCMRLRNTRQRDLRRQMIAWRGANRLSMQQAALIAGCTDPAWHDWEHGMPLSEIWENRIAQVLAANGGRAIIPDYKDDGWNDNPISSNRG
ncbi:MAG TPA: hypothetical protein PKE04_20825 [Clostridia bacterium]|nr:hypothetical protein [Clostridia bacterium]